MNIRGLAVVSIVWLAMSLHPLGLGAAEPSVTAQLDALVAVHVRPDAPGGAVLVRKGDQILLRKGYGLGDVEGRVPVRPEQVFRIGSLTKQLTAAAILLLADEGKLSVRDDIRKHLPGYPTHGATITIEHLLTHTSGIPSYTDLPGFRLWMSKDIEPPDLVREFRERSLEFQPGERMKYSNSGYHLLGLIIEKASGKSYADFMRDRLWKPLGMSHSSYGDDPRLPLVKGYEVGGPGGPVRPAPVINMKIPYSAGALVSSVDDLARWDAAIREGKLLTKESWLAMFSPGRLKNGSRTSYAYGWGIGKVDGRPAQSHGGGIPGFATHILRLPEDRLLVVVLFNSLPPPVDAGTLAHRLALTALGKPYVEPRVARIDPALLDRYPGVYRASSPGAVPLFVRREGDHLTLQPQGGMRMAAWPESETRFFVKDRLTRLSFVVERGAGPARALQLTKSNGETDQCVRTTEKLPP